MIINHNIPALQGYKCLNNNNLAIQKSIERLSTGLKINSASDDAAGFAISEKMRSQIAGLDRAAANTQDGISLLQTAEGALSSISSMIDRLRELSVQAANDTLTAEDRSYIQLELDELKNNIDNISQTTQFNKKRILDGSSCALWSSGELKLKAIVGGAILDKDQFGQKVSAAGNYKIEITA
ncbi:MAG: flagellin, partial [Synergistaceae bacterium]|nr:flagellin [Synergistaceae bacterium]